ncbi:MAG: type II toxin-antitoxin system HipA family toxin [Pseudomonadota bacterium]
MPEAYVYITLPGATDAVTAGRFEHTVARNGVAVGRFVYGRRYRERSDAVEIDPVELRLGRAGFETVRLGGVFGALRDSGPDYWGRRVIEKHAGLSQLGELDYLLHSPDDRAGALGFGLSVEPPAPARQFNKTWDLAKLQTLAEALLADEPPKDAAQVEELLLLGTSMGGARPKVVVESQDALWLAKFNRHDDRWNMARVEHATLELARRCGLQVADSQVVTVGGRDVLMVKRFDRTRMEDGYARARMVSALTLLETDETPDGRARWSYILLAETLRRISERPAEDARELFGRMAFNALISNTDDHPRNHAVIAPGPGWRLSPAYDLTPTPAFAEERRDLAMTCGAQGRFANAGNLLSECRRFLLAPEAAAALVDQMQAAVQQQWYGVARSCGVSEADCEALRRAYVYPGFRA